MAKRVIHMLVDDLDGGEADETIKFELDGRAYEIDLSKNNAGKMREALAPYLTAGAKITRNGIRQAPVAKSQQLPVKSLQSILGEPSEKKSTATAEPTKSIPPAVKEAKPTKSIASTADTSTYTRTEVPFEPTARDVRTWCRQKGIAVSERGKLRPEIWDQYLEAHQPPPEPASAAVVPLGDNVPAVKKGAKKVAAASTKRSRPATVTAEVKPARKKAVPAAKFSAGM